MEGWVWAVVVVLAASAVVAGAQSASASYGPVTGDLDAVTIAVDVSPDPLPHDRLATLHVRVQNTEAAALHRVVVRPFWPENSRFEGVRFDQSGWEMHCAASCERDPRFAIVLAPGDTATANVTIRVPAGDAPTSLLGLRATEDVGRGMLLAKEVVHSSPDPRTGSSLPDLTVLESLAVIVATLVAVVSLALRLLDRRRSQS